MFEGDFSIVWNFCWDLVSLPCLSGILLNNCNFYFNINLLSCEWWLDTTHIEKVAGHNRRKHWLHIWQTFFWVAWQLWQERRSRFASGLKIYIVLSLVAHTLPQLFQVKFVLCFKKWHYLVKWNTGNYPELSRFQIMTLCTKLYIRCFVVCFKDFSTSRYRNDSHYALG